MTENSCFLLFQLSISGHGQFRNFAKLGRPLAESDGVTAYAQDEPIGDVLLSVSGEPCTKDEVIWEILEGGKPRALRKDGIVCLVFDMCRSESPDHVKIFLKN